jgi:hypothetical protein
VTEVGRIGSSAKGLALLEKSKVLDPWAACSTSRNEVAVNFYHSFGHMLSELAK